MAERYFAQHKFLEEYRPLKGNGVKSQSQENLEKRASSFGMSVPEYVQVVRAQLQLMLAAKKNEAQL